MCTCTTFLRLHEILVPCDISSCELVYLTVSAHCKGCGSESRVGKCCLADLHSTLGLKSTKHVIFVFGHTLYEPKNYQLSLCIH